MEREPIPLHQAVAKVIKECKRVQTKHVPLNKAYGKILAEPIVATNDVPPFNRSAFDGYAIRAVDSTGASKEHPVSFTVIGEAGAGDVPKKALGEREAYRIMTGALLPEGADVIVMLEETEEAGSNTFSITAEKGHYDNVSLKGEDAKQGEQLIGGGSLIHPGTIALLATFGYAKVKVARQPKISIIATGTELLEIDAELQPGKIRNSNSPMLQAQLERMGISDNLHRMMEDDLDKCTEIVADALSKSDIVITTGGVSVGDYDYLPEIYRRLGAEVLFNKVMMRPGSITTAAKLGDKLLFGLSGNPSACFIGFELFVRPAILTMMHNNTPYLRRVKATLGEDFPKENPVTRFTRAIWTVENNQLTVVSAGFNKSSAISSIARGNCLIVFPMGSKGYKKGMEVDILLLGDEQGAATWEIH